MIIICLDFEGTLGPEVWYELAKKTNIKELEKTTADEPDYDKLMAERFQILRDNNLRLADIQSITGELPLMDGAFDFYKKLEADFMPVIVTGSFYEYILPVTNKLGAPMVYANNLGVDEDGFLNNISYQVDDQKRSVVKAFHALNYKTIAVGDSLNDLTMLDHANAGILFRPAQKTINLRPDMPFATTYEELFEHITRSAARI